MRVPKLLLTPLAPSPPSHPCCSGKDGYTYKNKCEAHCHKVDIDYEGKCKHYPQEHYPQEHYPQEHYPQYGDKTEYTPKEYTPKEYTPKEYDW